MLRSLVSASLAIVLLAPGATCQWLPGGGGLEDTATGTIWSDIAEHDLGGDVVALSLTDALAHCDALNTANYGGFSDWRLPGKDELIKAAEDGALAALRGHYGSHVSDGDYWSSTVSKNGKWGTIVNLVTGLTAEPAINGSAALVICARGEVYSPPKGGGGKGGGGKGGGKPGFSGGTQWSCFGSSTPGCQSTPRIDASLGSLAGAASISVTCSAAPSKSDGLLLLTRRRLFEAQSILGVELWVDLSAPGVIVPVHASVRGKSVVMLPVVALGGCEGFFAQYLWVHASCSHQKVAASNALAVTLQ